MPLLIAQAPPKPLDPGSPAGQEALRQGTGLTALTFGVLAVVVVCVIALLSWYRQRVIGLGRRKKKAKVNHVDAWVEAGKRVQVDPREPPESDEPETKEW